MSGYSNIDAWRARGRQIDCLGQRLFFVDEGDPSLPAVLLVHGFPTAGWDWHALWPELSRHFRLIAPDMLGFGFSAKPRPHNYTMHEQADLLEELTRQLGLKRFHVLAHDYGDTVAQELLARDNARGADRRCLSVALLNGGLFHGTHRPRFIQKLLLSPLGPVAVRLLGRATLARNMNAIFGPQTPPTEHDIDAFWALIRHNDGQRIFHRLIRYMRERKTHAQRWVCALRDAHVPIQLINGSFDPISGAHMVTRYRELVGDANIVELPGIGHYPQIEAPEAVARHYLAFVKNLAPNNGA
jgi:pimeloyl-ACP methyl ester carboxylesterase